MRVTTAKLRDSCRPAANEFTYKQLHSTLHLPTYLSPYTSFINLLSFHNIQHRISTSRTELQHGKLVRPYFVVSIIEIHHTASFPIFRQYFSADLLPPIKNIDQRTPCLEQTIEKANKSPICQRLTPIESANATDRPATQLLNTQPLTTKPYLSRPNENGYLPPYPHRHHNRHTLRTLLLSLLP